MKINKLLALLMVLAMLFSIVACSNVAEDPEASENESAASTETTNDTEETNDIEETNDSEAVSTTESVKESEEREESSSEEESSTPEYDVISIAEALEICSKLAPSGNGSVTEERYYIRGTVVSVTNAQYGAMIISDGKDEISVYGTYSHDGELPYSQLSEKPFKGDEVLLHCILQNYNGTYEIKNARLISFKSNQGNFDVTEYKSATIAEARAAKTGEKLLVSGIVARVTYANGMKPNGFVLVNGADSIYVYDGDAAARVQIGNRVEIAASKNYWILEDEQYYAGVYGYNGCNQLDSVTIISNDNGNNEWSNASFPTASIKELMDNPVSNDITTQIYKTTALIKKTPGQGFINYYIDDIDGVTGSYTYTQCNGGDFDWLDQFDGKICTVYLVVLNAKSTASGCIYRFLPVKVVDENFTFDVKNAAEYAVKYHGVTGIGTSYSGNPALELVTSVSSTLLGFENVALTYTSSDESVVSIVKDGDKVVLNCLKSGTAKITVTASHNGNTFSETVTVTVSFPVEEVPSINVSEAIATENGTEVTVKGIVGPSLANQTGFYLIDETGVIAVRTDADTMATLKIGNEVIFKGTKKLSKDTDGQICINSATLVQNNYGSHEYSTASFITGKTIADVTALDGDIIHTTEVYVVTGTIKRVVAGYSTNTYVTDGTNEFLLYAGGPAQYKWLEDYVGQTITIELAVCDWNNKGNKGCVLSITLADGTQIFNTLNFQ